MSLALDIDNIVAVLLADGWHPVIDMSFTMDAYEYVRKADTDSRGNVGVSHGGGANGICATGFQFKEAPAKKIAGPLTSIIAVQTN